MSETEEAVRQFKKTRYLIQGKYFLGDEINDKPTYVHIKKIEHSDPCEFNDDYKTIADVVIAQWVEYRTNTYWYFGKSRIEGYHYKRISKKEFNEGIRLFGKIRCDDAR